jgi:LPS O-antigen subunit length determinant protein (WzzB/FepE family)
MTHTDSVNQNQVQKSLVPLLRTWTHSIGWTVILSTLLAVLFALALDGCSNLR